MGSSRSVRWGVWVGLALVIATSCKPSDPPLAFVSEVRIAAGGITQHPWLGLGPRELEERAERILSGTGKLRSQAQGNPEAAEVWKATLELVQVRSLPPAPNEEGARADVSLLLTLGAGAKRIRADGSGQSTFAPHDPEIRGDAFRKAFDSALEQAANLLVLQLGAQSRSDEELISDLSSEEGWARDLAIRILTERRSAAAVAPLAERLTDSDRGIQLRAVGALVEIGDPAAAAALVDATSQRDPGFVIQVVYALGELGGEDAEAFLFTASTGHPEPAVRRAATEALEQLRAKRDPPVEQTHRIAP